MLKVQHAAAFIMADVSISSTDDPRSVAVIWNEPQKFTPYHDDFESIVRLSRSPFSAFEADAQSGKISADVEIVDPLFYYVEYPDHTLHLAAIELPHRRPRREGMWDSTAADSGR